ncbi:Transcriptional repressor DicA, partial [Dysosmobacter welbionis]
LDAVVCQGVLHVLLGAVNRRVTAVVALIAVYLGLHHIGSLAAAGVVQGDLHSLIHRDGVRAVHHGVGHAVGRGPGGQIRGVGDPVDLRGHAVAVVLNEPDQRQLPGGGHVQGLVEGALVGGAVAEAAHGDGVVPHDLGGQGAAGGDGLPGAHDAVGAQVVHLLHVRNVHGAALALAVAGSLAEQLRHGPLGVRPAGDGMAMAPVGGGEVVPGLDGREGTGLRCLLTDAQVDVARQHALGEALGGVFLKGPDPDHVPVQGQQKALFIGSHDSTRPFSVYDGIVDKYRDQGQQRQNDRLHRHVLVALLIGHAGQGEQHHYGAVPRQGVQSAAGDGGHPV